jgi:hypothetical protein
MSTSPPESPVTDPITELRDLVDDLGKSDNKKDFFKHLVAINAKIDLIREAVDRMCENTSGCHFTVNE